MSFIKGKELKRTDYLTIKTLNAAGFSAFSTFQIGFNPLCEELFVNSLQVRNAAGELISTGHVSDSYVLDDRTTEAAVSRKVLNLPVPGMLPGCTVELIYTRRELGTAQEFTFLPFVFSTSVPVQESILYLVGDTGAVRFASSPSIEPQTLGNGLCWRLKDPPVIRWEPLLPQVMDYVPTVWVCDTTTTWLSLVTNCLNEISDRMELPTAQKDLVRTLTLRATNFTQKVSAIASYVQTNYTYKAIEFGRRARVPQPLSDIIKNKYGDCKDHAILLQQMLKAAGLPASLALVNSAAIVRRDLPSLDQFNHMLVHIPTSNGDMFLDCTVKNSDLDAPWTPGLAGRDALVLDASNPRFLRIPDYPTNASSIRATRAVELTNQTDAVVHEEIVFEGVHAGYLRGYLRNMAADGRRAYFAGQIIGSAGQLVDLAFDGLEQPQSPLVARLTYLARSQFHLLENQIVGAPPISFERAFLIQESSGKRVSPFEVIVPLVIESCVTVNLPSQFKPKLPYPPTTELRPHL